MENMQYIAFTKVKLPYGWLGNMSPHPIEYNNKIWKTTEALFQALRFSDPMLQEIIRAEKSPMGAKLKAKGMVPLMTIKPLGLRDILNMNLCITLKLEQHTELKTKLLETGILPIYEDVSARGDKGSNLFWGAKLVEGIWTGQNVLGQIWMETRLKLN
jgi:predicted NAD-dependent protein-ADP-ribosyltransferase YbiA (DUF1768 family)